MNHTLKRIAYMFLFIPILFVPNTSSVDFADKKRIDQMNIAVALLIDFIGFSVILGVLFATISILS